MAKYARISAKAPFKTVAKYLRKGAHRTKYAGMRSGKYTLSRPMRKAVEAIIHKDNETKYVIFSNSYTSYNAMVNASEALRIMPDILNGTAGNQKIGNKIRLQRLSLRAVLTMQLNQTTANNSRFGVRLTCLRLKKFDDWNSANTDLASNYTKLLEGNLNGMDGSVVAFNTPLNLDYVTKVFDKKFIMTLPVVGTGLQVQDAPINSTRFVNNDIPYSRRFVEYDENNSSSQPVDYPYFLLVSYCKLDGTGSAPATGESLLQMQYTIKCEFEDA